MAKPSDFFVGVIDFFAVLAAIGINDEACPVAGEVGDVMADWDLATKTGIRKPFAE